MPIPVSAASTHGSTTQIAAPIGETLRAGPPCGAAVQATTAAAASDMAAYDPIVPGSAIYMGRWLPEAREAAAVALRVPDGDFRDWETIDAWAAQIAGELTEPDGPQGWHQARGRRPRRESGSRGRD